MAWKKKETKEKVKNSGCQEDVYILRGLPTIGGECKKKKIQSIAGFFLWPPTQTNQRKETSGNFSELWGFRWSQMYGESAQEAKTKLIYQK